jgi:uncharacterized protein (TIGR03435 family)
MRIAASVSLAALFCGAVWGQTADSSMTFEVASIKQSPPPDGRGMRVGCPGGPGSKDPGRITCTNINVASLVQMAYGVAHYQLAGVSISDPDRYEITAKVPEGATKDQVKVMWQNLLKERFKLTFHREKKDAQVFELVVAKGGPKMQESVETPPPPPSDAGGPSAQPPKPDGMPKFKLDKDGFPELPAGNGPSMIMMNGKARWRAQKSTTESLASMLASQLAQPVNDATGLKGKYDFTLSWVTEGFSGGRGAALASQPDGGSPLAGLPETEAGPTLMSALQSQLGLALEKKKGSIEMLVVDHTEKTPTEN